ncbi:MAG: phosphoserine phosphatase SerB [Rhodobacteraceae bacterium]|nr:phosphoserine phosphatase SerB [Paracoccaceae bacterium]
MFIATLITNPAAPVLDGATVEALRNAWGGGAAVWLAPDVAAEFPLAQVPGNRWEVWDSLQARGIDLMVQPAEGRRKAMLIADMDSTMIGQECIDELADMAGIGAHVAAITERAMNGELDFEEALRERVALLRGLDAGVIAQVIAERIRFTPGAQVLLATMRAHGAHAVLVSGGFTAFTAHVAGRLGFDAHHANTLDIHGGKLTGTVAEPILGRAAKLDALERIAAARGIAPAQVLAVGDGANDLAMLERAGAGVAYHAKPSVAARCALRVNHGDLTALLYLQGYTQDAFAAP